MGTGREELRLRRSVRPGDAGRSLRRPQPADHLPFHARTRLGRRMQVLLVPGGPLRCHPHSPGASRRELCRGFPRAHAAHPGVSKAHGLAFSLGLGIRHRLPARLRGALHERGTRGRGQLQLRQEAFRPGGSARPERVLQGRGGRDLPHLLHVCARPRSAGRNVSLPRSGSQGPRRRRTRVHHGMGPAPR